MLLNSNKKNIQAWGKSVALMMLSHTQRKEL